MLLGAAEPQHIGELIVRRPVERQPYRAALAVLEHQHHRALQDRVALEDHVRARHEEAAALSVRDAVHPLGSTGLVDQVVIPRPQDQPLPHRPPVGELCPREERSDFFILVRRRLALRLRRRTAQLVKRRLSWVLDSDPAPTRPADESAGRDVHEQGRQATTHFAEEAEKKSPEESRPLADRGGFRFHRFDKKLVCMRSAAKKLKMKP